MIKIIKYKTWTEMLNGRGKNRTACRQLYHYLVIVNTGPRVQKLIQPIKYPTL